MSDQPEALRLADALENLEATGWGGDCFALTEHSEQQAQLAAACLRRQHAERDALRADAERWRFWREFMAHADLDAAIDAARAALKEAK